MSRSGYSDDFAYEDQTGYINYRGQVASAMRGKRGQDMLKELLVAPDAMPVKRLITHELEDDGCVCALGALGQARGVDMEKLDPEWPEGVADAFDVAHQLAREVMYENDEGGGYSETPENRWQRMRNWVARQILPPRPDPRRFGPPLRLAR